jgi:hypothetical protein
MIQLIERCSCQGYFENCLINRVRYTSKSYNLGRISLKAKLESEIHVAIDFIIIILFNILEYGYSGGGGGAYGGYSSYDQATPAYGGPPSGAAASGGWGNQGQSAAPYSGYSGVDGPAGGYSTQQGGASGAPSTAYPSGLLS